MSHFVRSTSVSPTQPRSLSSCLSSSLSLLSLSLFRSLSLALSLSTSFFLFLPLPPSLYLSPPPFSPLSLSSSLPHTRTHAQEQTNWRDTFVRGPCRWGSRLVMAPRLPHPHLENLTSMTFLLRCVSMRCSARQHVAVCCIALLCLAV